MTSSGIHEEDALGKAYDGRLMRRLLGYLRPHRARVAGAILVLLAGAAVELAGPLLTKIALDRAIPERDVGLLTLVALLYLGALLTAFVLEAVQTLITTWLGQKVMFDLRSQIFRHLQRLPLPYFDRNPVGRTMTRVTSDVEVLNELFSSGVVTIFGDVFTLLLIVGAMFALDWQLALVTLTVMPAVFAVAAVFRSRIREAYRDVRVRLARINAFIQEHLSGVAVVQLFGREATADRQFRQVNDDYLAAHLRSITYYALFFPLIELLTAIALAFIITAGGFRIMDNAVTIGTVAAFLQFARRFFRPIQDLSEKYNMLQGAMASSERIFGLLDTPPIQGPAAPVHLPEPGRGEIEFRDVWFAYGKRSGGTGARGNEAKTQPDPGARSRGASSSETDPDARQAGENGDWDWVLKGISFRARAGERIAVVGHTGAGKTSLISLLLRFYEPQHGEILYDGVPVRDVPIDELRARIGLVLQDVFLFSDTVDYNIRLGRDDIADAQVRTAAERVGAGSFIERLPHGYDERLGERGASISVGERQLLSFARALAFDPQLLILDEATSSVDSAVEARIEDALAALMRGRTSVVIAHRLSTVQNADRILVLHHGELREEGTHAELLRQGGLYARLHRLQFELAPSRGAEIAPSGSGQEPVDTARKVV